MDALLRFLNRPVIIRRARPTRGLRAAFWCLLVLWLTANVGDLVATAALISRVEGGKHMKKANPGSGGLGMLRMSVVRASRPGTNIYHPVD